MESPDQRRAARASRLSYPASFHFIDCETMRVHPPAEAANAPSIEHHVERASKTQLKKASHELQDLGEAVVGLPDDRLAALPIDEALLGAIRDYRHTRSHEGRRRQLQYIGKLMRRADPEPLREAVAAMQLGRARDSLALHEAERWRAELIANDDALTRWTAKHPDSDLQQLRSLIRAARKDAAAAPDKRSGKAYRELFKFIREQADDE